MEVSFMEQTTRTHNLSKRLLSLLLAAVMILSLMMTNALITAFAYSGKDYTNNAELAAKLDNVFNGNVKLFSNTNATYPVGSREDINFKYSWAGYSGYQCYAYAQAVYYYLFGDVVYHGSSSYANSSVVIRNTTSLTYDSLNAAGVGCGAYVRTTNNSDGSYNGNYGHSMIILSYDKNNITILHGNADNNGLIKLESRSWNSFNTYLVNSSDRRVSHVVQPNLTKNSNYGNWFDDGTGFYAYIVKKDSWMSLQNMNGNVQLRDKADSYDPRQIWLFNRQSDGSYEIVNMYDNTCLDAANQGNTPGTNVGTYTKNNTVAQRWFLKLTTNDDVNIFPSYCNLALDVDGNYNDPGTNIKLWTYSDNTAQRYSIYKLDWDGLTYSKPAAPAASTISVKTLGTSTAPTVLQWTASPLKSDKFDERNYSLRIYKGSSTDGNAFVAVDLGTQLTYSRQLEAGTYTACMKIMNTKYYNYASWGNAVTFTVPCAHIWNSGTVTKDATSSATGVRTYTCTNCGETKNETIPARGIVTIHLNPNGGNGSMSDIVKPYGESVTIPATTFKRPGYRQLGWVLYRHSDKAFNFGGNGWSDSLSISSDPWTSPYYDRTGDWGFTVNPSWYGNTHRDVTNEEFTLYAVWDIQYHTFDVNVTVDGNGDQAAYNFVTFDVSLDGSLRRDDVGDHWDPNTPEGTTYTIDDIKVSGCYRNSGDCSYTGTIIGTTVVNIPIVTSHTWNSGVITTPATATTDGVKTYTCTACGATKTSKINKTGDAETILAANVTLSKTSFVYNAAEQKPTVTVKNAAGKTLTLDRSYTVSYSTGCKLPGTYTVTVTGMGNYKGTVKKTYTIKKQTLTAANVTLSKNSYSYNGNVQQPVVTVKNAAGTKLTLNSSYTVTYSDESKFPDTYTVTVTGEGNYTGTVKKTYTITKQTLTAANVTLSKTSFSYNGSAQQPTVTVKNAAGTKLTLNGSYTVSYSGDSKFPDTYTVTVTGAGNYAGTVKKTYTITKQTLAASGVTLTKTQFTYNGAAQKPTVTVKNAAGTVLTLNSSYTLTWSGNCIDTGTYTVTVTGTGNYTGTVTKQFTVTAPPKETLIAANVTLSKTSFAFNGSAQKPTVTVKNAAGTKLTLDRSYTVSWSGDATLPGTYTVTVTGAGNYTGTVKKTYTITKQTLAAANVTLSKTSFAFNSSAQKPTVTVKNTAGTKLTLDRSYTVSYSSDSKLPGTYTVTVTGAGNYAGTVKKTYTITKQTLAAANVTLSKTSFVFSGSAQKPTVTVKNAAGTKLTLNTSYTVSYSGEATLPGTYTVTVTGKGNYTGTVKKTYTIAKQALTAANVTLSAATFTFNGNVQKPVVTVKNAAGNKLTLNTSYTVSYSGDSKLPGTYTVTVTGCGNYTGTFEKTYTIQRQTLSAGRITLSATSFTYNGKTQKPTVTVKNAAGSVLTQTNSYTLSWSGDCQAKGTYIVTITGKGNYIGTVTKSFTIK